MTLSHTYDPGTAGCRSLLRIRSASGRVIGEQLNRLGAGEQVFLIGLGPVDTRPGDEIMITLECGPACTPAVLTVEAGRIIEERSLRSRLTLDYGGGTASTASSVWCNGRGYLAQDWDGTETRTRQRSGFPSPAPGRSSDRTEPRSCLYGRCAGPPCSS